MSRAPDETGEQLRATALPFSVEYRQLDADSTGFVYSSWQQSHHQGDPRTRAVPWHRYKAHQAIVIAQSIERGHVVVALDPGDPVNMATREHEQVGERSRRQIYGWACASDDEGVGVLHYVYVRQARRSYGLGRELVRMVAAACGRPIEQYSHSTITGSRFAGRLLLVSNPFAVIRMVSACA